tara:strand:+ start:728 stop:1243 length:516 start_codon:yes stop_codon:yes gene_type:complete
MQLGIAALFIIWVISRSNLSTTPSSNGNNTPSGEWIEQNFGNFPISFNGGMGDGEGFGGRVGVQMWTGQPSKYRWYVQYKQPKGSIGEWWNKTPKGEGRKSEVEAAAIQWLNLNYPPTTSLQNVQAPEAPPEAAAPAEVTITDIQTGRMQAVNQEVNSLSLNGTQDYALNG